MDDAAHPFTCHLRLEVPLEDKEGSFRGLAHLALAADAEDPSGASEYIKMLLDEHSLAELLRHEGLLGAPEWTAATSEHYQAVDQFTAESQRVEAAVEGLSGPFQIAAWSGEILDCDEQVTLEIQGPDS